MRILFAPESVTYKFPKESLVIPAGRFSLADWPIPSIDAVSPEPATIDRVFASPFTVSDDVIMLDVWREELYICGIYAVLANVVLIPYIFDMVILEALRVDATILDVCMEELYMKGI